MIYTITYVPRENIKNGKFEAKNAKTHAIYGNDVTNAINKFLDEAGVAKSEVKIIEVRLGA